MSDDDDDFMCEDDEDYGLVSSTEALTNIILVYHSH